MYTLVIWTIVGFAGAGTQYSTQFQKERDWRPIATFETSEGVDGRQRCIDAAQALGIDQNRFRCVRNK